MIYTAFDYISQIFHIVPHFTNSENINRNSDIIQNTFPSEVEKNNNKFIITSLLLITILVSTFAISVYLNREYIVDHMYYDHLHKYTNVFDKNLILFRFPFKI